ncbi:MAG TPA: class I SAM-dependent methyltransferase [Candidatus Baltobacteraceae bacterium]
MNTPSPRERQLRRAHPLAVALVERLSAQPGAAVIDFGAGSGRNTAAFTSAGFTVQSVPDSEIRTFAADSEFDAAVATHSLLHGTHADVDAMLQALGGALKPDAPLYATFTSKGDARYGRGTRIEPDVYAPDSGDEAGVPHVYFDEPGLRAAIEPYFAIESMEEHGVDAIAGTWAHAIPLHGSVHWFVRAVRRTTRSGGR